MANAQSHIAKAGSEKKNPPKVESTGVAELTGDAAALAQLPGGPIAAAGDGTIQPHAAPLGDPRLQRAQRHALATRIGRVAGNRHLQRVVTSIRESVPRTVRALGALPVLMRATLGEDVTQLATVNAAAAPLTLMDATGTIATTLGDLQAGDSVRILSRAGANVRVHVETGEQQGQTGFAPEASFTISAAPTSVRTPVGQTATVNAAAAPLALMSGTAADATSLGNLAAGDSVRVVGGVGGNARVRVETGTLRGRIGHVPLPSLTVSPVPVSEDAYAQLTAELNRTPRPRRGRLINIIEYHMTADQLQRLIQDGNPEYALLKGTRVISADDLINILNICGAPLIRKVTDYLDRRGRTQSRLRLVFSTANDAERRQVARDDALVGRLRPILGTVHPEIVFGTIISELYPAGGDLSALEGTNPNLARWLRRFAGADEDLGAEAGERAAGLRTALATTRAETPEVAHPAVMQAVNQAPRGQALSGEERTALDSIEEHAYTEGVYTSQNMGVMFLTRWARPLRRAASRPKTFIHRLWSALKQLPHDAVLLNNVVTFFEENPDRGAAGSYTDWLGNIRTHGRLRLDRPAAAEPLHAASAQNSTTIEVREPHMDLFRRGTEVEVDQADGTQITVTVRAVQARQRRLRFSRSVDVAEGAEISPTGASEAARGEAIRITRPASLYDDSAGAPDTSLDWGTVEPGNLFSKTAETTVGSTRYFQGTVYEGTLRGSEGWIEAEAATPLGGGTTMAMENFAWTVRHEMGHSLDLQIGGLSRFSAPSAAQWVKYTGVNDWVDAVIAAGGVANPDARVEHNSVTRSFATAARQYSQAIQGRSTTSPQARRALRWLRGWLAAGGSADVFDTVTQYVDDATDYFNVATLGLPPLGDRVYAAHYSEWYSFADAARSDSLSVGIPPYGYTCPYEFFAEHYAAYTGPGTAPERYARAVPEWALNFFDRLVGRAGAGPEVGIRE